METPNVNELMALDYEITIRRKKNGNFVAGIDDLGIFTNDETVSKAIENLDKKRKDLFQDLIDNEATDSLPKPSRRSAVEGLVMGGPASTVRLGLLVLTIFFGGFIVLGGLISLAIPTVVNRVSEQAVQAVLKQADPLVVARRIAPALNRFATQMKNVSPQRREEVLRDIRESIAALQPFVNEIRPLFVSPEPGIK